MTEPTDEALENLFVEETGFDIDDFPAAILDFARAVLAKWGQPSGATEEVENLRKALVYAAFALHDTPQYMLAQGMTLIDGDTVRVSRDGWTVEASVNPHRQPAPATQQAREVSDAMVLAALQVQHPAAYGQYLRHPANGPKTSIRAEAEIDTERRMISAALAAAPQPPTAPATQQPEGDVVAYLDVGANGYLDLGSELSEDALQQLPKGRHALVIAGTYGIDGYVAAPQPSPSAQAESAQEDAARLTSEQEHAIRQGHEIAASDRYFEARPQIDSNDRRNVFQAGFERGWDAARKQGGIHD